MTTEPINEIDMSATQQITVKTGDDEQAVQNRHAFRLLLGLGFIVFLVSMTVFIRIWAEYAYVYQADMVQPGAGIFGGLIIIATAFLAKRGNATLAMIIVTITFFAVDFFLITLLWNIGLPLTITITIGLILIASQVLPGKQVVPGVVAIFSIGTILLLIDIFWAAPRDTTAPQDLQIIYVGAFVIVATGLFVAIRQFSSFSLRTKLVSGAIALVVITVLFTTIFVNSFMRATLTEQLNEKFQLVGQSQASAVVEILTRQVEIMETLSLDSGLRTLAVGRNGGYSLNPEVNVARVLDIDERWTSDTELQEYLTSNTTAIILKSVQERFPSHAEMFMTDNIGAIVGATNVTSDYYQADEDWWQQAYNEGQGNIYIGEPAFDESRGVLAINIAVPMFDAAGEEFLGVLRTTYVVEELATLLGNAGEIGETGELELVFKESELRYEEGSVLLEPIDESDSVINSLRESTENIITYIEGEPRLAGLVALDTAGEIPVIDALGWALIISQIETEAFTIIREQQQLSILMALVAIVVGSIFAVYATRFIAGPINRLTETAVIISEGELNRRASVETQDEIGTLAIAFNRMTDQLRTFINSLETRVASRTQALVTSTEVSRRLSTILNLDELVLEVVNQVRDAFEYYHVQIYLFDEQRTFLYIVGGTGEAGQQMLAAGHKLSLSQGLVGRAAATNQVVLIPDVTENDNWLANDLLPETKAEVALPIALGNTVYGVLDVQHNVLGGLNEESVDLLQSIANQVAIALQNARAFTQINQQATIIENSEAFISTTTMDGLVSFVNPTALRMLGYERLEDVMGVSFAELQPEVAQQFESEILPTVLETGVWHGESTVRHLDGNHILVDQTISLIRDGHNQPSALVTNAIDITERKQAETQLAERVKQLNLLNIIGQKADQKPLLPEFLRWASEQISAAMRHPALCVTSISLDDVVYGDVEASSYPRHIVEELRLGNKSTGYICTAYTNAIYEFGNEESALIGNVGSRISNYIENQRLIDQIQKQTESLQAVTEIGTAVAAINHERELLHMVVELTNERFSLYDTGIFLVDQPQVTLILRANASADGQNSAPRKEFTRIDNVQSWVALSARSREHVVINDVAQEPNFVANPLLPLKKSELSVPLISGENEVIGVLHLQSKEVDYFSEQDIDIFNTLAFQIAVALQNTRQYEQTQSALDELNALQRVITGEGWQTYMEAKTDAIRGYIANDQSVEPIRNKLVSNGGNGHSDVVVPLTVRGARIGNLGIKNAEGMSSEDKALVEAVSRQVSEALERARLFEESEVARQQTNALYTGGDHVIRANTAQEILEALVDFTAVSRMDRANFLFFNRNWDDSMPETMDSIAVWEKNGSESLNPVGQRFTMGDYPFTDHFNRFEPTIIHDIEMDDRADEKTRRTFLSIGMRSVMVFPLVAGDQWIGLMIAQAANPTMMSQDEIKQIGSLVSQASVVAQTQKIFQETESRAQQQQILRQVSERVYGAFDAESVLKTAVQEVSRSLGLEAFIYLENEQDK